MCSSPNNIFRSPSRVSSKKYFWVRRLESYLINYWHIPFSKIYPNIPFNPLKSIILTYCHQNVVAFKNYRVVTSGNKTSFTIFIEYCFYLFKLHANKRAVFYDESFRYMIIMDRYSFSHCIFNLPFRSFHLIKRASYSYFNFFCP